MLTPEIILQTLISGILIGCIYALVAVGLCLIWGLMEIVNFAHGQFMMLAMFLAFWMYTLFGVDPIFTLPLGAVLLFVVGVATYYLIIKGMLHTTFFAQIFATFGLGVFLHSMAQFLWTANYRSIQNPLLSGRIALGQVFIGFPQLAAAGMCIVGFLFLYWLINKTEIGLALQAASEDREAASLMGINSNRIFALGWGIGSACVGIAGVLLANFFYVFPEVGFTFALIAYVAVALGGFGSIVGSFLAGIIIGLVESFSGLLIDPAFKYFSIYVLYMIVIFFRPQGLWGRY
ncbi:MAG TPA: branched-chain amino acid ABC transporter permease [Thermodesulfobacteriota bacterium]|nr:branched-chain amino acid ABC transporter permease [Thermodesulfobacteriota bacterium]